MSATMTQPKSRPAFRVSPEDHAEAVKSLMNTCMKVDYSVTGLPKSKQASSDFVERVADAADGDAAGFSVGKRLLSCDHAAIDELNVAVRKIAKWRNTFTFAMVDPVEGDSVGAVLKKAKGQRLIRRDDIEDFEQGLESLAADLAAACKTIQRDYGMIMSLERQRLGNQFNASDYPDASQLWKTEPYTEDGVRKERVISLVRVGRRSYEEVKASVSLPPLVLKRMSAQASEIMNQTIEVAVAELTNVLTDTFQTLAKQLVDRIKLRPRAGTLFAATYGSDPEVLKVITHAEDVNVPEGHVKLDICWKEGKTKKQETVGPMTLAAYDELRPTPMDETKRLTSSVVDRMREHLDVFANLKDKLGVYGAHMDVTLDTLRDLLETGGNKTEQVIDSIKSSSGFRAKVRNTLNEVSDTLLATSEEVKRVRRRIHSTIAAQIQQSEEV